ncbi:MAG: 50S ribosomal protein L6 [Ignavibacteria bacterium]|nr:50S ribosomal protein L6 [Ignavibacteria bacterium]
MSRIGKKPIVIPGNVKVEVNNGLILVKGPKGELSFPLSENIEYQFEGNTLTFIRKSDDKKVRAVHGLTRAVVSNMITGVVEGFTKTLQIEGIGYKAEMKGRNLLLSLGYSHPILLIPPDGVQIETPSVNTILVKGIDKQRVGEVSAKIKKLRPVEPYKGKGIRYLGEYVRRKAGKLASR